MGRSKQLLPLGDRPVIRHCVETLILAGLEDIVVVVGAEEEGVCVVLEGLPVKYARNGKPDSEMAESVRIGLGEVEASSTGVLVFLSDHPLIRPDTVRSLVVTHEAKADIIIIPIYNGRRGHPTLFPAGVIKEIFSRTSLRDIIGAYPEKVFFLDVEDAGVALDMDTEEDYREIVLSYQKRLPER